MPGASVPALAAASSSTRSRTVFAGSNNQRWAAVPLSEYSCRRVASAVEAPGRSTDSESDSALTRRTPAPSRTATHLWAHEPFGVHSCSRAPELASAAGTSSARPLAALRTVT